MRTLILAAISFACILLTLNSAHAAEVQEPELSGWSEFLKETVLYVGRSDRVPASRPVVKTGGRINRQNSKKTKNEGNRLFYHSISTEGSERLTVMRQGMEAFTQSDSFQAMTDDQELAFWLNFHNLAVIEFVAQNYPVRNAQRLVDPHLDEKVLSVFGKAWSIRQIENYVLEKWEDPIVIYGFHRGHIGSPNIRPAAFTGTSVWKDLKDNAEEFVNSLRGVQYWGSKIKASVFYRDFEGVFPDMRDGFRSHLMQYASGQVAEKIKTSNSFTFNIKDGTVTDLFEGYTGGGSAASDNPAALSFSRKALRRGDVGDIANFYTTVARKSNYNGPIPLHTRAFLKIVHARWNKESRNGNVTLEEYISNELAPTDAQEGEVQTSDEDGTSADK